jgi:RNA polymerase sigma-70 factor (ECF subfamily)
LPRKHCRNRPRAAGKRSDSQLIEGIRRADQGDFALLYDRYFPRIYAFAYGRLRNHADTEEVVQETFMAVFRSIDAYRGQSSLLSWIYGIAKNTVNNHIRRARAHDQRVERAELELVRSAHSLDACTPEEHLCLRRYQEAIQDRLADVADWHHEVFVLRHVENLPIGEIARRVSRSNDAVRSSLYRIKRLLVEAVDPHLAAAG